VIFADNQLSFYFFNPALLFTSIIGGFELQTILLAWPLGVFPHRAELTSHAVVTPLLVTLFCWGCSALVVKVIRRGENADLYKRIIRSSIMWSNCGTLPMIVVASIVASIEPWASDKTAVDKAIAYTSVYMVVVNILYAHALSVIVHAHPEFRRMWTVGYHDLRAWKKHASREMTQIDDFEDALIEQKPEENEQQGEQQDAPVKSERVTFKIGSRQFSLPISQTQFYQVVTPTNISLLLGMLVTLVTPLRLLFVGDEQPPLGFLFDALQTAGFASLPISALVLGSTLAFGPRKPSDMPLTAIALSVTVKLVITPIVGLSFLYLCA
jgi:predicted permease